MDIEELYYVYYIPNARGEGKPKVGMTGQPVFRRLYSNKLEGKNTDGNIILYATFSLHDALRTELEYQIQYDCVETPRVKYNPSRRQLPMTKEEQNEASRIRNKKLNPLVTCPHCGKQGGRQNMIVWHFDHCPKLTGHRRVFT
jgi:hypothetical protein